MEKKEYIFKNHFDTNLKLSDIVVLYNSGDDVWKIIPFETIISYPVIYDTYVFDNITHDITIAVSPISLIGCVFKGLFSFNSFKDNVMILQDKQTDDLIPIDMGYKISDKYIISPNKRFELKIMTLKSALYISPDPLFLEVKHTKKPIFDINYYQNFDDIKGNKIENLLIHPKTLVYIIQYKSHTQTNKNIICIGNDANINNISGYDFKQSKLLLYLEKNRQSIINHRGYVIPVLWYIAKDYYIDAKIINL